MTALGVPLRTLTQAAVLALRRTRGGPLGLRRSVAVKLVIAALVIALTIAIAAAVLSAREAREGARDGAAPRG
jgi:hypothetical protein